jgi:AcrR family transcriptional regulator
MNLHSKRAPNRRDEARDLFRRATLDAAEEVFASKGFHAARIQDVAARARIGVGTVYNHFESKEALLAALLEERAAELTRCLAPEGAEPAGFAARLEGRVARLLGYVQAHRGYYRLIMAYGPLGGAAAASELMVSTRRRLTRFRDIFRALIDEGVASGALDPELAPELPGFLWGTIRSVISRIAFDENAELVGKAPLIVRLFMTGARRGA